MLPKDKAKSLPQTPGVYFLKDKKGKVLYIGKAKSLRLRVQSYFRPKANLDPGKQKMVKLIADIETITCDTETEALILEANLIHQHQPPYNIVLRDDKYYLFIKITTNEAVPRVFPVRQLKNDSARYFGPYSSTASVRYTLKLLRRLFPHEGERKNFRDKIFPHPLFNQKLKNTQRPVPHNPAHQANKLGTKRNPKKKTEPRTTITSNNSYDQNISCIINFLQGNRQQIIDTLTRGMKQAAKKEEYERAAIFRDQLNAIQRLEGSQKVYFPRNESFDVISITKQNRSGAANIFSVRQGKLLAKNIFLLKHRASSSSSEILRQFLLQYYSVAQDTPRLILIPHKIQNQTTISKLINKKTPPVFKVPQRGKKRSLLKMGQLNAKQLLNLEENRLNSDANTNKSLEELASILNVKSTNKTKPLSRIETYDISNTQGKLATGSMIVFNQGKPNKKQYKKFKINLTNTPNDYAMLQEVLSRRFANSHKDWPKPDLILIDGGRGQLNVAQRILTKNKINIPIVAIAKKEETLFTYNQTSQLEKEIHSASAELAPTKRATGVTSDLGQPTITIKKIQLPYDSPALFLLQRMRDEAHRFTISYHQLLRSKHQQRSLLDEIPGIGPKTKKRLLNKFGSLASIHTASDQDINKLIGKAKTSMLRDWL